MAKNESPMKDVATSSTLRAEHTLRGRSLKFPSFERQRNTVWKADVVVPARFFGGNREASVHR